MMKVLHPGLWSSIQDLGRFAYRDFGVPFAGVMDEKAAIFANNCLGNDSNAAVLELTYIGAKLQFLAPTYISISGAKAEVYVNNKKVAARQCIKIGIQDIISFGSFEKGARLYVAIVGGFETSLKLGSRSMYSNITTSFRLQKGDKIPYNTVQNLIKKNIARELDYIQETKLEVYPGPEYNLLNDIQLRQIFGKSFTVSSKSNRMAYQFEERIQGIKKSIITAATLPGTVQCTPAGQLIVLMKDAQTTGGYPRVLQLSDNALVVLAQKRPTDHIEFNFTLI